MTPISIVRLGGVLAICLTAIGSASTAGAATPSQRACFSLHQLQSTRPDGDQRVYFRVGLHDVYRLDLAFRCSALRDQEGIVLLPAGGQDLICTPLDLDLRARQLGGGSTACMIKSITRLTPEEAAALPPKVRP